MRDNTTGGDGTVRARELGSALRGLGAAAVLLGLVAGSGAGPVLESGVRATGSMSANTPTASGGLNLPVSKDGPRASKVGAKPAAELIYFEPTIRNRTPYIVANAERLRELPFDGLMVHIPASWLAMSGERWTFDDSFAAWIEPLAPVFADPGYGLRSNYLMVFADRPADYLGDWSTATANFADLAQLAREGGFVGIAFDNEEYFGGLWDWPDDAAQPELGRVVYDDAARSRGLEIGEAMAAEFPAMRLILLHGPYIADAGVPNFVRRDQFGVGEFELFGPFYAGLIEGLGDWATLVDGGETYALREAAEFRDHALWRRWGLPSAAHDAAFLDDEDRRRHRAGVEISFGVYTRGFPVGMTMNPGVMRTTLENALRGSDRVTWLYSEEGLSAWEPDQFGREWLDAVNGARAASLTPAPRLRFGIDDLHRIHRSPFDSDLNGVVDLEDRSAVEGEARLFEWPRVDPPER